jgi:uncharacterized delta-60 repeat protein
VVIPRRLVLGLAAFVLGASWAGPALAAGELDPRFGAGGKAVVLPGVSGDAMALAPDGSVVVAGAAELGPSPPDFAVARLGPSGRLDPGFGVSGLARVPVGSGPDEASGVALGPDGTVVVAGYGWTGTVFEFAVARLGPGGSPDTGFGVGGRSLTDFGGTTYGQALALAPDGAIVVAGMSGAGGGNDFAVARLRRDGHFDTRFGVGGKSRANMGGADAARSVALAADGTTIVVGESSLGGETDIAVARLRPDGYFDTGFGEAGRSGVDVGGADLGEDVALGPDGSILIAGSSSGGGSDMAVVRLRPNGSPDPGFGVEGRARVGFGGNDFAYSMALAPDGKILVAGGTSAGGTIDFAVARLQPNGSLDTTFGTGGKAVVDLGGIDTAHGVGVAPDGAIVLAGNSQRDVDHVAVVRLQGDPRPGSAAGPRGPIVSPVCAGRRATIVGTAAPDRLRGTPRRDVIAGLGGGDTIRALGGADIVCGGPGRDTLAGGGGADRLLGGPGRDRLLGGPGRDRLVGGAGRDVLRGGPGRDVERR